MLIVPGFRSPDTCDGPTRRDFMRVGGSAMLGLSLTNLLALEGRVKAGEASTEHGPGFGKAKSVIMIYLQGGPSHLDLWDPKENLGDKFRSAFKTIPTKIPGTHFTAMTEHAPTTAAAIGDWLRDLSRTPA